MTPYVIQTFPKIVCRDDERIVSVDFGGLGAFGQ